MIDEIRHEYLGACRTAFPHAPAVCARVLLVGEDNPISSAPEHALFPYPENCAGHRLCNRVLAVRRATYCATWRTNLCVGGWKTKRAKERARALLHNDAPWNVLVLLGKKVHDAFGRGTAATFSTAPRFGWIEGDDDEVQPVEQVTQIQRKQFTLVSLPHPSGRNLIWNDPRTAATARAALAEVVPDYPWGEALA